MGKLKVTAVSSTRLPAMQEQEEAKRENFVKELRAVDGWAADAAGEGEACGWLCGAAGDGCMTLADISYFPFLERIDATVKPFKVNELTWKLGGEKWSAVEAELFVQSLDLFLRSNTHSYL